MTRYAPIEEFYTKRQLLRVRKGQRRMNHLTEFKKALWLIKTINRFRNYGKFDRVPTAIVPDMRDYHSKPIIILHG